MQRDRHAAQFAHHDDRRRGETSEAHDAGGAKLAHEFPAHKKSLRLRHDELHETSRAERERRAGNRHEVEMRILFDQARIDAFLADEQRGLVPATREPFGERDAGRKVSAGAAAGE